MTFGSSPPGVAATGAASGAGLRVCVGVGQEASWALQRGRGVRQRGMGGSGLRIPRSSPQTNVLMVTGSLARREQREVGL